MITCDRLRQITSKLIIVTAILSAPISQAFVLVSGDTEATLPSTFESPAVRFYWDGHSPDLNKLDEFPGGQYQGMPKEEVMENLLLTAMGIWNQVPGSFVTMELETDPDANINPEDSVNSITTSTLDSQTTAAYAVPTLDGNVIHDCDISISNKESSAKSLAYTIAHELGHCLGLGHAHTNYGAMMGYARDTYQLKLGADDIAGLIYLYPNPDYVPESPAELGCGSIAAAGSNRPENMLLLVLLLLTPVFLGPILSSFYPFSSVKINRIP